ncbi:hypothetical protein ACFWWC_30880 [Streptomyces sp. NPDC058642]|uniref:hypothetical protein n=1 Tax=Streptomyces sp. NPDC058642 TaxID=3346572 RepID=UPI003654FA53
MTQPPRARSHGAALLMVTAGAVPGRILPRRDRHLPADGLSLDGMITLAGFVATAITLVVQCVTAMSPRLVAAAGDGLGD